MKKIYFQTAMFLFVAVLGLTSCSDDDDNNKGTFTPVSMAETKTIVAVSEAQFSDKFSITDFSEGLGLVEYFNSTYYDYTRSTDNTVVPFANLMKLLAQSRSGYLSAITTLLEKISEVKGTYRADTSTKKWMPVTDEVAPDGKENDELKLYFNDYYGKECCAQMKWFYKEGSKDSLIISDNDETIKVLMPSSIYITLVQNGTTLLSGAANFDYIPNSKLLNGLIRLTTDNGYSLNAYIKLSQNVQDNNVILIKNGQNVISAELKISGSNFIDHVMNNSIAASSTGTEISIRMNNDVGLMINIKDVKGFAKAIKDYYGKDKYTTDDIDNFVDICNSYIYRNIFLYKQLKPAANLTFQASEGATGASPFAYVDSKVNFYSGESCMLNELFTGGERAIFVKFIHRIYENLESISD